MLQVPVAMGIFQDDGRNREKLPIVGKGLDREAAIAIDGRQS